MKYFYFRNTYHLQGNLIIFVQGFSLPFSVEVGGTVQFKIKTESEDYRIDIFRVGWYWGAGARQVQAHGHSPAQAGVTPEHRACSAVS